MKLTPEIVQGFVNSVLAPRFDESTSSPEFHVELWTEACSEHPFLAIAAPRGHAKSTAGTLAYGLAELLFRCSRYLVIVSDTEGQAAMFVQQIASELQTNENLINLFGLKKNEKGIVQFVRDSQTDIIVAFDDGHTFRVVAKGAEQKLRGMLWNHLRPDLVIIDDLENDELVMNKERRTKLREWVRGALVPLMSRRGKMRMWGTILHEDSVLNRLMPKVQDKFFKSNALKDWTENPKKTMWKGIKYRAHSPDFKHILWPDRFNREYFRRLQQDAIDAGESHIYSQEYLNNPLDETRAMFKRSDLLPMVDEDRDKRLKYYITADLAISQSQTADYSVFMVSGVDEDRVIQIRQIIKDRLDAREIIDMIFTLDEMYEPEAIGIEKMLITQTLGPILKEEMIQRDHYLNLYQIPHGGKDKVQRARPMQARTRAKTVKFDKRGDWYPDFEDEITKFPRAVHDDQVDAFALLGMLLEMLVEAQTDKEVDDEEYYEEFGQSGEADKGRSRWTGY